MNPEMPANFNSTPPTPMYTGKLTFLNHPTIQGSMNLPHVKTFVDTLINKTKDMGYEALMTIGKDTIDAFSGGELSKQSAYDQLKSNISGSKDINYLSKTRQTLNTGNYTDEQKQELEGLIRNKFQSMK